MAIGCVSLDEGELVCRLAAIESVGRPVGFGTLSRFRKTWELNMGGLVCNTPLAPIGEGRLAH